MDTAFRFTRLRCPLLGCSLRRARLSLRLLRLLGRPRLGLSLSLLGARLSLRLLGRSRLRLLLRLGGVRLLCGNSLLDRKSVV